MGHRQRRLHVAFSRLAAPRPLGLRLRPLPGYPTNNRYLADQDPRRPRRDWRPSTRCRACPIVPRIGRGGAGAEARALALAPRSRIRQPSGEAPDEWGRHEHTYASSRPPDASSCRSAASRHCTVWGIPVRGGRPAPQTADLQANPTCAFSVAVASGRPRPCRRARRRRGPDTGQPGVSADARGERGLPATDKPRGRRHEHGLDRGPSR